ncbi:hypothetical protein A4A49_15716 [Nicotiana attenuata]|uniref:Uncharacterized protein n=1 Tax=Nicotiana attenuata TaxID=49451 RepID=A0A1J6JEV8_NICAT|nr:hypothetical protein A4A49_15716 [Nicotiana attenuata]
MTDSRSHMRLRISLFNLTDVKKGVNPTDSVRNNIVHGIFGIITSKQDSCTYLVKKLMISTCKYYLLRINFPSNATNGIISHWVDVTDSLFDIFPDMAEERDTESQK